MSKTYVMHKIPNKEHMTPLLIKYN